MSLFARRRGRHARHGTSTGWAELAAVVSYAQRHPVLDLAVDRPAMFLNSYGDHR